MQVTFFQWGKPQYESHQLHIIFCRDVVHRMSDVVYHTLGAGVVIGQLKRMRASLFNISHPSRSFTVARRYIEVFRKNVINVENSGNLFIERSICRNAEFAISHTGSRLVCNSPSESAALIAIVSYDSWRCVWVKMPRLLPRLSLHGKK